jgi:hypothetical protein
VLGGAEIHHANFTGVEGLATVRGFEDTKGKEFATVPK